MVTQRGVTLTAEPKSMGWIPMDFGSEIGPIMDGMGTPIDLCKKQPEMCAFPAAAATRGLVAMDGLHVRKEKKRG